jgi:hypothetical protein
MQDIHPGEINSRKPDLPEGAGNRFSIGNVQHQGKGYHASRGRDKQSADRKVQATGQRGFNT